MKDVQCFPEWWLNISCTPRNLSPTVSNYSSSLDPSSQLHTKLAIPKMARWMPADMAGPNWGRYLAREARVVAYDGSKPRGKHQRKESDRPRSTGSARFITRQTDIENYAHSPNGRFALLERKIPARNLCGRAHLTWCRKFAAPAGKG